MGGLLGRGVIFEAPESGWGKKAVAPYTAGAASAKAWSAFKGWSGWGCQGIKSQGDGGAEAGRDRASHGQPRMLGAGVQALSKGTREPRVAF